jgi:transposase-like protein
MSTAEIHDITDHLKIKTKLVCSSCGAPGEGSCRCGAAYVTPGERAEAAVKASPDKSNRMISEETGIPEPTVRRARNKSGASHDAPAKRTGRDGKAYRQPQRRTPQEKFDAAARLRQQGKTQTEAAKEAGLGSVQGVKLADRDQQVRSALLGELGINPETLAVSAKAKLNAAIRVVQRKLDAEHAARMRNLNEEVRQRVLSETKEYLAMVKTREEEADKTISNYREYMNHNKPLFTVDQFKTILMCLHPDGVRTQEKLSSAFRLFNHRKFQLTGEK